MRSYISASALVAATAFAGSASYWKMGSDWGETVPLCGEGKEQSPIDLGNWAKEKSEAQMNIDLRSYTTRQFQEPKKPPTNGEAHAHDYSWKIPVSPNGGTMHLLNGDNEHGEY